MPTNLAPNLTATSMQSQSIGLYPDYIDSYTTIDALSSETGKWVSEEIYWDQYYNQPDFSYEWNNGQLEEKPMPDPLNYSLYQWFSLLLRLFLERHPIARQVGLEMGFRLPLPAKTTIRKPDLFIVRHDNPVPLGDDDRSYRGICDLCIESISDSTEAEVKRDTKTKKVEYELIGVHEYYILDARHTHTAFYQRTSNGDYASIPPDAQGVIRSTVLPGFQFRLADLYQQPSLIRLAEDPIYRAFVLPEYQAEKARAERLAAKLRELGIEEE